MPLRLFCLIATLGWAIPCFAQQNTSELDKQFTADVLKKTLFAKTLEEQRFCDYVIQKRDDGTIPARLIYGAYRHAITKDRVRRFSYFKTTLEILCRREGIALIPAAVRTTPTTASPVSLSLRDYF